MILVIDNYDSFTYNLVQYLFELGATVEVVRNDRIDVEGIRRRKASRLLFSPGPCTPNEAGVTLEALRVFSGSMPILGVCLGHQALGQAFGGKVVRARHVMHGKTSRLEHDGRGLFFGMSPSAVVGRYHSLVVERDSLPAELEIVATAAEDGEIMALRHRSHPTAGVQFHPESVLTPEGKTILRNFLEDRPW